MTQPVATSVLRAVRPDIRGDGGVTARTPPKPTLSYEQAVETAEELYDMI